MEWDGIASEEQVGPWHAHRALAHERVHMEREYPFILFIYLLVLSVSGSVLDMGGERLDRTLLSLSVACACLVLYDGASGHSFIYTLNPF